ncbi:MULTISPECIES: hypothetical protein [unclassified Methylobacterium]|jgi:hypothetical protein|uniref:hypothetical protein n=1 Tax=unclassified Methylobacterium TaxID=2615210 RepID=UPI0011C1F4F5|nr:MULTISPECIES: hypothetical protein [unclassified Methylobacterium]QEE37997.1 hypothetical protein FVA80_02435 [Methylobacterium sp. WL1]TXN05867.1 hypothetical protein FV242_01385 [Methylobacterium sp. WL64]TXN59836.1 hypothetical protein FV241_00265 [Methylobacterium sp. WL2]
MLTQALAAQADHACPVDAISRAYLSFTGGDAGIALRCAIADALSDLMEAERRTRERSRLISRGYVREAPMVAVGTES